MQLYLELRETFTEVLQSTASDNFRSSKNPNLGTFYNGFIKNLGEETGRFEVEEIFDFDSQIMLENDLNKV